MFNIKIEYMDFAPIYKVKFEKGCVLNKSIYCFPPRGGIYVAYRCRINKRKCSAYFLELLYIGKTDNLHHMICDHLLNQVINVKLKRREQICYRYAYENDELVRTSVESVLLYALKPKLNENICKPCVPNVIVELTNQPAYMAASYGPFVDLQ